jgi:hypothetical protein
MKTRHKRVVLTNLTLTLIVALICEVGLWIFGRTSGNVLPMIFATAVAVVASLLFSSAGVIISRLRARTQEKEL